MPVRAALLPLASVLHRSAGPDALDRPVLGLSLLERQLRLLRATGHAPIVLLGGSPRRSASGGTIGAATGADAAEALAGADVVTVLGHGVLIDPAVLIRLNDAGESLLVRPADDGWERINAEWHWAGAMSLEATVVREALAGLGDWDAQATLLRLALQRGVGTRVVADGATAHGFVNGGVEAMLLDDAERRLATDDGLVSRAVQREARPIARALADRTTAPVAELVLALLGVGAFAAALADRPVIANGLGLVAVLALALALAVRRLRQRGERPLRPLALLGLGVLPGLAAWSALGGLLPVLLGVALVAVVAGSRTGRGLAWPARLDVVFAALTLATLGLGALSGLALVLSGLLTARALRPAATRRLMRWWRGLPD